jgi:C_GCAxxG_C_C family probable redox protein
MDRAGPGEVTRAGRKPAGAARAAASARAHFDRDFNCAESVLAAIAGELGLKSGLLPKVASGFGAGMSRQGSVCGAVAGAVMALGLKYGRVRPTQSRTPTYRRVQALCRRFERKFGSIYCRDLIGHDMSSARALARAMKSGVLATRCPEFVAEAVKLYFDLAR